MYSTRVAVSYRKDSPRQLTSSLALFRSLALPEKVLFADRQRPEEVVFGAAGTAEHPVGPIMY